MLLCRSLGLCRPALPASPVASALALATEGLRSGNSLPLRAPSALLHQEAATGQQSPLDHRGPVELAYKAFSNKEPPKDKSPLFLLHSLMGCRKNWKQVAKEVHHMTRRTTVTIDARNHGQSPHVMHMSYDLMAADVHLLMKKLDMKKVSLLGSSMGGRIAMLLALRQPALVDKLICVDATAKNSRVSLERWQTWQMACRVLKDGEEALLQVHGVQRRTLADKLVQTVLPDAVDRSVFLTNLMSADDKNPELWKMNINAILSNPKMTASFPDFKTTVFEGKVLFVAGSRSRFLQRSDEAELLQLFPNAKFAWIPDSGPWVQVEKHKEFMEVVVPFLEAK